MGSRRVLGNDPFQRGAAQRTPAAPTDAAAVPGATSVVSEGQGGDSPPTKAPARRTRAAKPTRTAAPRGSGGARTQGLASRPGASTGAATTPTADVRPEAPGEPPPPLRPPPAPEPRSVGRAAPPAEPRPPVPPLAASVGGAPASGATLQWTPLADAPASPDRSTQPAPRRVDPGSARSDAPGLGLSASVMDALREAPGLLAEAWSALEAAARAIRAGLGTSGGEQLDVYGRDGRLSEAVAPLLDFLYSRWFRVEVEGAAHVPAGGALLVANHAGALPLDGPMLHEALRRERPDLPEARWLAEDQVFYAPVLGTLFNRLGAVRASPDSATRLLAEGRPVLIFPEGIQGIGKPFRDRYQLQRFGRGGFVKLALRTGRPILPVAIMGAEETLPLLGKLPGGLLGVPYVPVTPLGPLPLPAKWRIRIGEPITVPAGALETDLSVVESMVDATRSTIEHMLRALLGARGGVFLG